MANRFFGEVDVEVDGKTYTLRCDFNAMIAFEDATGKDAMETFEKFEHGKVGIRDMRAMMHAFLKHHQPSATPEEAGEILSRDMDVLQVVLKATMPTEAEVGDSGNAKPTRREKKAA